MGGGLRGYPHYGGLPGRSTAEAPASSAGEMEEEKVSEEAEIVGYTGQIRKILSLEVARSQARMLLDRLEDLGNGAAAAAKRREWAEVEERRMGRERLAFQLCLAQRHHIRRRGQFLLM